MLDKRHYTELRKRRLGWKEHTRLDHGWEKIGAGAKERRILLSQEKNDQKGECHKLNKN